MQDRKNKVIVTPARSGSSWLVSSFARNGYNAYPVSLSETQKGEEIFDLHDRIDNLYTYTPFVTKVFCDELIDLTLLQKYKNSTDFIWLYRNNRVEHFLSNIIAWQTGVFTVLPGETYVTPEHVEFPDYQMWQYEAMMIHEQVTYNRYKHLFTFEIAYEDLIDNNPWGFKPDDDLPVKGNVYSPELLEQAENKLKEWNLI